MTIKPGVLAAVLVLLIGAPFGVVLAMGFAQGERTRREAPLRAVLGDDAFEMLQGGEMPPTHYMGNHLLAPDFTLKDKDGNAWTLSEHRGKTVVLNFWSITCQPCVEEMPSLEHLARVASEGRGFEVVAISTDKDWDTVKSVMGKDSRLKVLFDPDKSVVNGKFGTRLYPETWVIDPEGFIRVRVDGKQDWSGALAIEMIESY